MGITVQGPRVQISIHALLAESDAGIKPDKPPTCLNFYPRSPCGERQSFKQHTVNQSCLFLSTLSLRRATRVSETLVPRQCQFLSTLSLRRATHYDNYNLHCVEISIHALLAESDHYRRVNLLRFKNFYPRSPCGERQAANGLADTPPKFLSTLSLRRATMHALELADAVLFLSTLSLRRATHQS